MALIIQNYLLNILFQTKQHKTVLPIGVPLELKSSDMFLDTTKMSQEARDLRMFVVNCIFDKVAQVWCEV